MMKRISNKAALLLMLAVGFVTVAATALVGIYLGRRDAQRTMDRTVYYLERQCVTYREIIVADEVKSLVRLTEQATELATSGVLLPGIWTDEYLEDYAQRQRMTDVLVLDGELKPEFACGEGGPGFLPGSAWNEMRREALDKLLQKRSEPAPLATKEITLPEYAEHEVGMIPQLAARFETAAQLPGAEYLAKLRYLILPIREADAVPQPLRCKTLLELPRAAFGTVEPDTMRRLAALEGSGFAGVVANNLAQFGYASPLPVFGGLGLNVTNPMSAAEYVCLGACGLLVQPETALTAMRAVAPRQKDGTPVPTAALCYGHLPLMLTRACPLRNVRTSCAGCTHKGKLRDRKGRDFPVRCSAPGSAGMRTVFNPVPLYMGDRLTEMPVDLAVAAFTLEPADRVEEVLTHLFHQQPFDGEFTRGLYYTNN